MQRTAALVLALTVGFAGVLARAQPYELEDTVSVISLDRELVAHARLEVGLVREQTRS